MNVDSLFSLLWSCFIMILVGIFLLPVIRELTSRKERQENHTSIDDLIKQKQRWLQVSGHSPDTPNLKLWRETYIEDRKLLESFLTWGDSDLLNQVNQVIEENSLGNKFSKNELYRLLISTKPKVAKENQTDLVHALVFSLTNDQKDLP